MVLTISIFLFNLYDSNNKTNLNGEDSASNEKLILDQSIKYKVVQAQREKSQKFLKEARTAIQELRKLNFEQWDPTQAKDIDSLFRDAESMHRLRRYFEANKLLQELTHQSKLILSKIPELLNTKLEEGYLMLEQERPITAMECFNLALLIDPYNNEARFGLKRAINFNEIQSLFIQAEEFERINQKSNALATYRRIIDLDSNATEAQHGINRIIFDQNNEVYKKLFNMGQTFFENKEFGEAKKAFLKAEKIFPNSEELKNAISELERAQVNNKISEYIKQADHSVARYDWSDAAVNYKKALELDNQLVDAANGYKYSSERKTLNEQIVRFLKKKEYPIAQETFVKGKKLMATAMVFRDESTIANQIERLSKIVDTMEKMILTIFKSDNQTDIELADGPKLGKFVSVEYRLSPGKYKVLGRKDGYDDVSKTFSVSTDTARNQVYIYCKQKQRKFE